MIDLKQEYKEEFTLDFKEGTNGWYAIHLPNPRQGALLFLYKYALSFVADDIINMPKNFYSITLNNKILRLRGAYNAIILLLNIYFDLTPDEEERSNEILQQIQDIGKMFI